MSAGVTLDVASVTGTDKSILMEYRQTKGFILVERPGHIRIRAQAPLALATVFDMVSDGRVFRVSVPLKNKFYMGDNQAPPEPAGNPVVNLRPKVIMDALFVDIREHLKNPQIKWTLEEAAVGRTSYYVVQFINIAGENAELIEKLWVDRTNMNTVRKQTFGSDGKLEMDVEYSGHQSIGEISYPQVISIQRIEDYSLKITFQKNALNQQLAADAFRLEPPAGAEVVQLKPAVVVRPFINE
jgi:outer membrane lipoprotein-sorting protein